MNTAIGICTLLVGGWVLPSIDPPITQPDFAVDPRVTAAADSAKITPQHLGTTAVGSLGVTGQSTGQMRQKKQREIPSTPTASSSLGAGTRWMPPTASSLQTGGLRPTGSRSTRASSSRPGSRRSKYQQQSAYSSQRSGAGGTRYTRGAATAGARSATTKPFSNYRSEPAISPYLNLFRADAGSGVNNYYTLVRPFVEQRHTNQHVGGAIRGLQRTSRTQSSAIRRINRDAEAAQGRASQQYYQNFRNFFPGMNR